MVDVQTAIPSVHSQSQGTMSPINAHHSGKAIKAEEIAISQANTSLSKASTDINFLVGYGSLSVYLCVCVCVCVSVC